MLADRVEVPAALVLLALEVVRTREGLDGGVCSRQQSVLSLPAQLEQGAVRCLHPCTPYFSHSALPDAVQSTSPMTTFWESANSSESLSQSGFIDLQWPHQGAKNLTKADLPESCPAQLSMSSSSAPCAVAIAPIATTSRNAAIPQASFFAFPKRVCKGKGRTAYVRALRLCRDKQRTALLTAATPTVELPPPPYFDPQQLRVQLNHPLAKLVEVQADNPRILPGIACVSVHFSDSKGGVLAPSLTASTSRPLCERMAACVETGKPLFGSGSDAAQMEQGSNGAVWWDLASPGHVGSFADQGATRRTLGSIEGFKRLGVDWLARLAARSLEDNGTWVRVGRQPCSTAAGCSPKLHIDGAINETCNGLGKVRSCAWPSVCAAPQTHDLCLHALAHAFSAALADLVGGRPFVLSADLHGDYRTELARAEGGGTAAVQTPCFPAWPHGHPTECDRSGFASRLAHLRHSGAVAMVVEAYTSPHAMVYHAAGEGEGDGLTLILTLRERYPGEGYADLPARLAALGLVVTPL